MDERKEITVFQSRMHESIPSDSTRQIVVSFRSPSPNIDLESNFPSAGAEDSITVICDVDGNGYLPQNGSRDDSSTPPGLNRDATVAASVKTHDAPHSYKDAPIGSVRKNWGCWTCLFRGHGCKAARPFCRECKISDIICDDCKLENRSCSRCLYFGLVCEFGCPSWWHDPKLRYHQRCLNVDLTKQRKVQVKPNRRQRVKSGAMPRAKSFLSSANLPMAEEILQPSLTSNPSLHLSTPGQPPAVAQERLHPVVASSARQQLQAPSGLKRPLGPDSDEYDSDDEVQQIIVNERHIFGESQGTPEPGPIISHRSIMMDSDTETPEPYPIINRPSVMLDLFNISDRHPRSETT